MSTIDIHTTVGQIVRQRPARTRILERLGIDYCCGGRKPLAEACHEKGLDAATVAQVLEAAEAAAAADEPVDLAKMTMTQLIDHIESTHHVYLKQELPRVHALARKVAAVHAGRDASLADLAQVVDGLVEELSVHLEKEEQILFPSLRELEQTGTMSHACFGTVRNPIRMMEYEHDSAAQAFARIRELTADHAAPDWACNTYRTLLDGLRQLESDTHQHIHKENNLLFPLAVETEAQRI